MDKLRKCRQIWENDVMWPATFLQVGLLRPDLADVLVACIKHRCKMMCVSNYEKLVHDGDSVRAYLLPKQSMMTSTRLVVFRAGSLEVRICVRCRVVDDSGTKAMQLCMRVISRSTVNMCVALTATGQIFAAGTA